MMGGGRLWGGVNVASHKLWNQTSSLFSKLWLVHLFKDWPLSLYIFAASESDKGLPLTYLSTNLWPNLWTNIWTNLKTNGTRNMWSVIQNNTIVPAITILYTNMFISLITYLRGLFVNKFVNKSEQMWTNVNKCQQLPTTVKNCGKLWKLLTTLTTLNNS